MQLRSKLYLRAKIDLVKMYLSKDELGDKLFLSDSPPDIRSRLLSGEKSASDLDLEELAEDVSVQVEKHLRISASFDPAWFLLPFQRFWKQLDVVLEQATGALHVEGRLRAIQGLYQKVAALDDIAPRGIELLPFQIITTKTNQERMLNFTNAQGMSRGNTVFRPHTEIELRIPVVRSANNVTVWLYQIVDFREELINSLDLLDVPLVKGLDGPFQGKTNSESSLDLVHLDKVAVGERVGKYRLIAISQPAFLPTNADPRWNESVAEIVPDNFGLEDALVLISNLRSSIREWSKKNLSEKESETGKPNGVKKNAADVAERLATSYLDYRIV